MSIIASRSPRCGGLKTSKIEYALRQIKESSEVKTYTLSKEELTEYLKKYK